MNSITTYSGNINVEDEILPARVPPFSECVNYIEGDSFICQLTSTVTQTVSHDSRHCSTSHHPSLPCGGDNTF
jgi:hypothetical protein